MIQDTLKQIFLIHAVAIAVSLPVASTGVLLLVLTIIFVAAIMKYKSKHKTQT